MTKYNISPWQVWFGAFGVGLIALGIILVTGGFNPGAPTIVWGVALALLVALGAWLAYRRGNVSLAIGAVGGYALLSLISGGQCTLLVPLDEEPTWAIFGGLIYPLLLLVALVVLLIVEAVRGSRGQREEDL